MKITNTWIIEKGKETQVKDTYNIFNKAIEFFYAIDVADHGTRACGKPKETGIERNSSRHIIIKATIIRIKERILKTERNKTK